MKDATKDPAKIREWWTRWPDANIGIATGSPSGIVVLDVDNDKDKGVFGSDSLADWESEQSPLPRTWVSLTGGGGMHYLFKLPEGVTLRNRAGMLPGLDARGEGGYIVAPPSLHISGHAYEWEANGDPADTPIARLPDDLQGLIMAHNTGDTPGFELPAVIEAGARNDTLFRLAASLRAKELSEPAIIAAVSVENAGRCQPPLSDDEVRQICRSASRYQPGRSPGYEAAQAARVERAAETLSSAVEEGDFAAITSRETMEALFAMGSSYERQQQIAALKDRARKLKKLGPFNDILAAYRREHIASHNRRTARLITVTDCPIEGLRCSNWQVSDNGIRKVIVEQNGAEQEVWAASQPVVITKRLKNIDNGTEKVELAWMDRTTGVWQRLVVAKATIANRNKIVELAAAGLDVTTESAKHLVSYLNDLENASTDVIPFYKSIGRLGWLNQTTFAPYMDNVYFDGEMQNRDAFEAVATEGSADVWLEQTRLIRERSPLGRIALAASFASPLVYMLNKLPFFTHFWGGTEAGKTVALMLAMSVWGNPALGKLVRSFNATPVALERLASFCHSIPLALDELQTIRSKWEDFDRIIYHLGEGQGKGRGTKDGGMEQLTYWRLCVLTTGEEPLTSDRSGGGAKNRAVEIYCSERIFEDAPAVANLVQTNYGHAGQMYTDALCKPEVQHESAQLYDLWYRCFLADGCTEKQSMVAGMLCTADHLSGRYVWGIDDPDTGSLAKDLTKRLANSSEIDVTQRSYEAVCGWITSNQGKFLNGRGDADKGEIFGRELSQGTYAVISTKFSDMLQTAGFAPRRCLPVFAQAGYIDSFVETEDKRGDRIKYSKAVQIGKARARCVIVHIHEKYMEGSHANEDYEEVADVEDLPF